MRIVIISKGYNSDLIRSVANVLPLAGIIWERRMHPRHFVPFYWKRFKKRPLDSLLEMTYQLYKMINNVYNAGDSGEQKFFPPAPVFPVMDANGHASHKVLAEIRPDIIILDGCSVIRRQVLSLAGIGVINVHAGINPIYRGGGNAWACINRDWENLGVSVHWVDAGIDTGNPLAVLRFHPGSQWPFFDYFNHYCVIQGIDALVNILKDAIYTGIWPSVLNSNGQTSRYYPQLNLITYWRACQNYRRYVIQNG